MRCFACKGTLDFLKIAAYANSTEHNIAPLWSLVKISLDRVNEV